MTKDIVYLNGDYLPIEEARIPVLDRGFVFGDGIYEVIPAYSRRPFRMDEHLVRLENSLASVRLANPLSRAGWRALIRRLIRLNEPDDQSIYFQVTRGVAPRDHAFPKGVAPTVFAMSTPLKTPARALVASGVDCVSAVDYRWLRCDIKSVSLLGNCLMKQHAVDHGAAETIMFRDGYLTEASASNIFIVRDGTVIAPPKGHLMLPGITYDVVIELARNARMKLDLREVPEAEVRSADEIWVTSSTKEVIACTRLDGKRIGTGKPGPVFKRMHRLYQEYKRRVMRGRR
jgi:D-alanine transaminase